MALKADYKNDVYNGNRKYDKIENPDGTISLEDVTEYIEEGDSFSAVDINATNKMAAHMIYKPILDTGVVTGDCVLLNPDTNIYEKTEQGNGIVDGAGNVIKSGGIATGLALTKGYTHYVPSDGGMPTTTPTNYEAGFARSVTELEVRLPKGGRNQEYTENMITVKAIIGKSLTFKIQTKMPVNATGYYVNVYTSEPTASDDETTGQRVADLTQDYLGNNVWYTVENVLSNTTYWVVCYPYQGNVVNRSKAPENQDVIYTQNVLADWSFDNVDGNIVKDDANDHHLTNYSVPMSAYKVGNGIERPYGTTPVLSTTRFTPNEFTVVFFFNASSFGASDKGFAIIGECASTEGWAICSYLAENRLRIYAGDGSSYDLTPIAYTLSTNTDYFIGVTINKSAHTAKLFVNGVYVKSVTGLRTMKANGSLNVGRLQHNANMTPYGFKADQMKVIEGEITVDNFARLYNGGVGC